MNYTSEKVGENLSVRFVPAAFSMHGMNTLTPLSGDKEKDQKEKHNKSVDVKWLGASISIAFIGMSLLSGSTIMEKIGNQGAGVNLAPIIDFFNADKNRSLYLYGMIGLLAIAFLSMALFVRIEKNKKK